MKKGKVLVEQVLQEGVIVDGYDISLSPSEISAVLFEYFPNLKEYDGKPRFYVGEYEGNKYTIRCKNVTYLGNPHPKYKKRIQISDDLFDFHKKSKEIGASPILLGIYTSEENTLFVDFRIDTYIEKKAHNSSAHVYTDDLAAATLDDYFQKTDFFGNTVTVFKPCVVNQFLDEFFRMSDEKDAYDFEGAIQTTAVEEESPVQKERLLSYVEKFKKVVVPEIKDFFFNVDRNWNGIDCYTTMIESNYRNKYQPEWVGFFLEFCFEKHIKDRQLENVVTYYQDKKDGGIDLDLFFPEIESFGDLKAHSEDSKGIQGNDWDTVFSVLNRNDETSHIYYIVCEHATEKDSQYDYEVTRFWNTKQNKPDLMSYHKRMKNNVTLKRVYILDINNNNKEYLTVFKQGINSNGKPRPPKIMIEHDNIHHFIIEEIKL